MNAFIHSLATRLYHRMFRACMCTLIMLYPYYVSLVWDNPLGLLNRECLGVMECVGFRAGCVPMW